ncbi:DUF3592 domain-containing protein [Streptomyces sp. NPDC051921]|uniref:DUF3592 domain-containing protein n=1 Tax=Streptomyces sp. NPDC051921 TaxID=3155806 RepID=UPI003427B2B6
MSSTHIAWLIALAFTPTGAVLATAAHGRIREIRRLIRTGERAQGVVIRLEPTQLEGPGSESTITVRRSGTTAYYPVIAWTTVDGQAMETRTHVARPLNRTLSLGARVDVRYDAAKPSRWTLPAEKPGVWWLFVGLGGLCVAIGTAFVVVALSYGP